MTEITRILREPVHALIPPKSDSALTHIQPSLVAALHDMDYPEATVMDFPELLDDSVMTVMSNRAESECNDNFQQEDIDIIESVIDAFMDDDEIFR